jgi:hypothetical protein
MSPINRACARARPRARQSGVMARMGSAFAKPAARQASWDEWDLWVCAGPSWAVGGGVI